MGLGNKRSMLKKISYMLETFYDQNIPFFILDLFCIHCTQRGVNPAGEFPMYEIICKKAQKVKVLFPWFYPASVILLYVISSFVSFLKT